MRQTHIRLYKNATQVFGEVLATPKWCYASHSDVAHFIRSDVMCSVARAEGTQSKHHARSAHHIPLAEHIVEKSTCFRKCFFCVHTTILNLCRTMIKTSFPIPLDIITAPYFLALLYQKHVRLSICLREVQHLWCEAAHHFRFASTSFKW